MTMFGRKRQRRLSAKAELVAAADPNEPLTGRFTETYGCPVYEDAASLLENEKLDAAYVFGSNLEGSHMAIEAMERGLHILIEKPLAANLDDANQMLVAARKNNVQLLLTGRTGGRSFSRRSKWLRMARSELAKRYLPGRPLRSRGPRML